MVEISLLTFGIAELPSVGIWLPKSLSPDRFLSGLLGIALSSIKEIDIDMETKEKTLCDVPIGQSAKVAKLAGSGTLKRRIMDMGITRGTEILVRKVAPLGDPIEVTIRGYELSLRKSEAESILMQNNGEAC